MVPKISRSSLLVGAVFSIAALVSTAKADTLTASLFSPMAPSGGSPIVIDLTGVTPVSQSTLTTADYIVTFSPGFSFGQGIVQGMGGAGHAVPVAGETGGMPEYLTGGFGSAFTTNIGDSGNYFSTGADNAITITFLQPQKSLELLWGSIDSGNSVTLSDGFTVTGADVQAAAAGFVGNGFQGPGGSAYVVIDSSSSFTSFSATSSNISFEFAGVAAATSPFGGTIPEPATLVLFGTGLAITARLLRRNQKKTERR